VGDKAILGSRSIRKGINGGITDSSYFLGKMRIWPLLSEVLYSLLALGARKEKETQIVCIP
jgi:hypothetical protein